MQAYNCFYLVYVHRFVRDYKYHITYYLEGCNPLMDSANMNVSDWERLAEVVEKYYDQFDGFVILHGTDTMCYTASALSFMLENLSKPVVLTGAQVHMHTQKYFRKSECLLDTIV